MSFSGLGITSVLKKDGLNTSMEFFEGKYVLLYFGAHWSGPCQQFTPKLVKRYNDLRASGVEDFEIIFISNDLTETEALKYFASMPWVMVPHIEREVQDNLSDMFNILKIPTLVFLNKDGSLITNEAKKYFFDTPISQIAAKVEEKRAEDARVTLEIEELKSNPFDVSAFFSTTTLISKDGPIPADTLKGKTVGIYFSAHWCIPCRDFTPKLISKYSQYITEGKPMEIIFVSLDTDQPSCEDYFSEMPWKMLSFEDRYKKRILCELFQIRGIPSLQLIFDGDRQGGSIIPPFNGNDAIFTLPFEELHNYPAIQAEKKLQSETLVSNLPSEARVDPHPHLLLRLPSVYQGYYLCDVCHSGGSGWVYHCGECNFDAHPKCTFPLHFL